MSRCCSALSRQPSALVLSGGPGLLGRMYNARNATPKKNGEVWVRGGEEEGAEERPGRTRGASANWRCRAVPSLQTRHSKQSHRVWTAGQNPPMTGVTERDVDAMAPFSHACSTLTPAAFLSSVSYIKVMLSLLCKNTVETEMWMNKRDDPFGDFFFSPGIKRVLIKRTLEPHEIIAENRFVIYC